jgi:hypothetical protein
MATPVGTITKHTEVYDKSLGQQLFVDQPSHFMHYYTKEEGIGQLNLVGYAPNTTDDRLHPTVQWEDLSNRDKTIAKLGKGIGIPRLYNTPHAAMSWPDSIVSISLYEIAIDLQNVYGVGIPPENDAARIMTHATRMKEAKQLGLKAVAEAVDAQYGKVDGVYFTLPPRARVRAMLRGVTQPMIGAFIVPRNANLEYRKIGEQTRLPGGK